MELILDRKLSDRRLFPAIDIPKSGTRKEEKLFPKHQIESVRKLRRMMVDLNPVEAMETLIAALKKRCTNLLNPNKIGLCLFPQSVQFWKDANETLNANVREAGKTVGMPVQTPLDKVSAGVLKKSTP